MCIAAVAYRAWLRSEGISVEIPSDGAKSAEIATSHFGQQRNNSNLWKNIVLDYKHDAEDIDIVNTMHSSNSVCPRSLRP